MYIYSIIQEGNHTSSLQFLWIELNDFFKKALLILLGDACTYELDVIISSG